MARADIGTINCPICAMSGAHVRETEKRRAYILCEECNVQIFARGADSDKKIRAAMKPEGEETPAEKPAPKEAEPAPQPKEEKQAPIVPPAEKTMFDFLFKQQGG